MLQMNSASYQSKIGTLMPILSGTLIGFLVWKTYFWIDLPDWLIRMVINKGSTEFLTSLFGSRATSEHVLVLAIYLLKSIPGALMFGLIGGVLVARAQQGRRLVYSTLIWPLWLSMSSYVSLGAMMQQGLPGIEVMWVRRAEHQELQLLMYSSFLLVLFTSSHVASRALVHNSSLESVATRRSA